MTKLSRWSRYFGFQQMMEIQHGILKIKWRSIHISLKL